MCIRDRDHAEDTLKYISGSTSHKWYYNSSSGQNGTLGMTLESGNLTVAGNLTIEGSTTTLNTTPAKKHVIERPKTIVNVYFLRETVSISLPAHIIVNALKIVAIEYRLPNCVLLRLNVSLKSSLKREIKNVCPNPDANAIKKPNINKFEFLYIKLIKTRGIL